MKPNASMIRSILTVFLVVFAISFPLHAATKIKPVVVTGDPAPDGGLFSFVGFFSMNNPGAIAFLGSTPSGSGIYLATERMITRLIKPGDTFIIPELLLSGVLVKKETDQFDPSVVNYEFSDGHKFSCNQTGKVLGFNFGSPLLMNDPGDIAFDRLDFRVPTFFSGGTLTNPMGCPGLAHLIMDLSEDSSARIDLAQATAINNAGTVVLRLSTSENDTFNQRHFLIIGGIPTLFPLEVGTPAPGGGTIVDSSVVAINDSGDLLIAFFTAFAFPGPGGLFLDSGGSRIPIALIGQPAVEGKTFRDIRRAASMNNAGEVVFIAELNDFSAGIFHWADGILTPLVRRGDSMPGGGTFFDFGTVEINDNGDVAFRASAFFAGSGLFLLKSTGGLSKVVLPGEAAPGGGNFAVIGQHKLNNKGDLAFLAILSNGKRGIFLAGPGLETEFVDPVPDLLADSTVTSEPTELANKGRVVTGIAADGAARVVVRVKTGQTGTAEFSLVDEGGASLPASNFNGSLSQVGEDLGSSSVSVSTVDVEGFGPMAFAAYHAPVDFSTSPNSLEAGKPDRKVFIKVKLTTATGETVESTESLKIVRPPVVLVHGLWGDRTSWFKFFPLLGNANFSLYAVNYKSSNARDLSANTPIVARDIKGVVEVYKLEEQVAAVRADIVTHSMGGLLVRRLPLLGGAFFRNDNFGRGDVHRLINIATPHFGSRLANILHTKLNRPRCVERFHTSGAPIDEGAIGDLRENSQILNTLNGSLSPLRLHNLVGRASEDNKRVNDNLTIAFLQLLYCGIILQGGFDAALGDDNDLIVPVSSQLGGFGPFSDSVSNFPPLGPNVIHTNADGLFVGLAELDSEEISLWVNRLLNEPRESSFFAEFPAR